MTDAPATATEQPPKPRRPRISQQVDVVLHVGMGKSGTSSVQFFLRDHREALAAQGVLYPRSVGGARHGQLSLYARSAEELAGSPEWARREETDRDRFRRGVRRRLAAEIERSGLPRVLFSDEALFGARVDTLRRLRRLLAPMARSLRIVVYLRRQDDHMVSRYQQEVKVGCVRRLDAWAQQDMSHLYDYDARLQAHHRLWAPDQLVVRRFEPPLLLDGSLVRDFLHAAGLELPANQATSGLQRNVSLDAESVEFLRLLNLHRVAAEDAVPGTIDNRELVAKLAPASDGPVLTLRPTFLEKFMAQWEESNRRVAATYFGEPGPLFTIPRKSSGTTTEQRLDPARLDHFLAVCQLPEPVHGPLRKLAEQEAAGS